MGCGPPAGRAPRGVCRRSRNRPPDRRDRASPCARLGSPALPAGRRRSTCHAGPAPAAAASSTNGSHGLRRFPQLIHRAGSWPECRGNGEGSPRKRRPARTAPSRHRRGARASRGRRAASCPTAADPRHPRCGHVRGAAPRRGHRRAGRPRCGRDRGRSRRQSGSRSAAGSPVVALQASGRSSSTTSTRARC